VDKQAAGVYVQTPVQTAVQTGILETLTVMERAIVWALLNSEMKLSYEDLSVMLGKNKSTIRGQINAIKQKSEGLIEESSEANGKKRVFIPEEMKQIILKKEK
jgi:predicted transcriptional regulator